MDGQTGADAAADGQFPGMPTWVKALLAVGAAIVLLALAAWAFGGGEHGPGRHLALPAEPLLHGLVAAASTIPG